MKKRLHLWCAFTIVMTAFSFSLVSCGGDDASGENTEKGKVWITGTVRGFLWDLGIGFKLRDNAGLLYGESAVGGFSLKEMVIVVFRKDFTALYYALQDTEDVAAIRDFCLENGPSSKISPFYEGTWTQLAEYPEWSYYNGKIIYDFGEGEVYEYNNPKKLTYSVNTADNSITILDEDGKLWEWGILYINMNDSKTSWSELRNADGELRFHIWNTKEPLDNSRFTSGK